MGKLSRKSEKVLKKVPQFRSGIELPKSVLFSESRREKLSFALERRGAEKWVNMQKWRRTKDYRLMLRSKI